MSTLTTIIEEGYDELQEDIASSLFWPITTCRRYIYEGMRDIFKRTHINLTERAIPMYAQVKSTDESGFPIFESFSGFYTPPLRQIQTIQAIFWKGVDRIHQLDVLKLDELDQLDPNWRTATSKYPTHAVLFSGDFNEFNMQTDPRRNGIKIKLYPTPTDINPELQTALYQLQSVTSTLEGYSTSAWSTLWGGLASATAGGITWGLDTDGDGERDDIPVPESTATGLLVKIINGEFDISEYDNYPIIRYVPDFSKDVFNAIDGSEFDLDSLLPYELQLALRDYMIYRCYHKEGEASDKVRAEQYLDDYETKVLEYVADNELYDTARVKPDSNSNLSRVSNTLAGSTINSSNNSYNQLRL